MKQFLIEVQTDQQTRVQVSDEQLCQGIKRLVDAALAVWTDGSLPAVTVTLLTKNQEVITWK